MKWEVTKQVLAAVIRWILAGIGAWMIRKGIIDAQTADAWINEAALGICGLIVLSFPVIWKVANARFNILSLIKAVQRDPPADTKAEVRAAVAEVKADVKAENNVASI